MWCINHSLPCMVVESLGLGAGGPAPFPTCIISRSLCYYVSLSPRIRKCLFPAWMLPKVSAPTPNGVQRISCIKSRAESHGSVVLVGERERGRRALGTHETWVFSTWGNPGLTVSYAVRWSNCISSRIFMIREAAEFTMSRRGPSSWSPGLPYWLPTEPVTKNFQHLGQRQSSSLAEVSCGPGAWILRQFP